ncbi:MAG: DNA polymerase-3 subunit alpha [Kiritimatiellia bacterium]|jgi:DNA polymerase-3 subunit alpha
MSEKEFCHLHFHTCYSLLDGAVKIKEAMKAAAQMEMKALAITDHGVLHGAIDFYKNAKANGINPIIGCELYLADNMHERKLLADGSQSNHQVALATNEAGYNNLMRLSSAAHLQGFYYKPRVDLEMLSTHADGLIGTSSCLKGQIPECIVRGETAKALELAGRYEDIFGKGNFYLELQDHGIEEQKIANRGLIELAKKTGMPLIASNDVHYLKHEHWEAHDVMLCMQTATTMADPRRLRYNSDQFYMKTAEEMWKIFGDYPSALTNTLEIAERCNLELKLGTDAPLHFPVYVLPEDFKTDKQFLTHLSVEAAKRFYDDADIINGTSDKEKELQTRFRHELSIIEKTGFINYFLVVWDFVHYAKRQKIPVGPGRGSGAGSLVAYLLGITAIDPLRYGLIFERFLNPDRISPPDFDIDFCQARRGEVIEYVIDKYGKENCAQIITFGTLGAKTVIRDLGRVLDIPLQYCDRLAKMIPEDPGMTLKKALELNPEFKAACATEDDAKKIMKYAVVLEGLPRNQGTHAAGVVIGEKPLPEILPLCRDKNKQAVTQYEMKPLEETGLLKMDFLGLKTLTVIQEAADNVAITTGTPIVIEDIPLDDEKTFALLNAGDTTGVFQVESKGMKDLLRQFQLTRFEDLIAMIALYRPGPMDMIPDFIKRRHKRVEIVYDHPLLEKVLEETYGVFIYQEQVQLAANVLAGFTLAQGDLLRRAMGKKILEIMEQQRKSFVAGAKEVNNIPEKLAGHIFDTIEKFASYGFNKSHSAAYAVISWQTAYFKAHHPTEFMAALLSSEMNNTDKLPGFIAEVMEMGYEVRPPTVQGSGARFRPEEDGIRFGMGGIKNVGLGAVEAIVREREANGPYESLMDFCMRVDSKECNKKVLESLVKCGTFDWTGMHRRRMFDGVEFAMSRAASTLADKQSGQGSLFDMLDDGGDSAANDEDIPDVEPWPMVEMLTYEKELLGFYISGHPLDRFEWETATFATAKLSELGKLEERSQVRVTGLITDFRKLFTRKTQEAMAAFRLEGKETSVDAVIFPGAFKIFGWGLHEDMPVVIGAEVSLEEEPKLMINEVYPLVDCGKIYAERLTVQLNQEEITDESLEALKAACLAHPGEVEFIIDLMYPTGDCVSVKPESRFSVNPCQALIEALAAVVGEERVNVRQIKRVFKKPPEKRSFRKAG